METRLTCVCAQVLGELPNLKQVELDGNPFSSAPGYKHIVVNYLQGLTSMDGDMLMKKQRDDAAHYVAYHNRRGLAHKTSHSQLHQAGLEAA